MIAKIAISLIVSAVLATGCVSIQEEKKDVLSSIDQYKVVLNVPPRESAFHQDFRWSFGWKW